MAFFTPDTGRLAFLDGLTLEAYMPAGALAGDGAAQEGGFTCLGAHSVPGGSLAPVCQWEAGSLRSVTLHLNRAGGKPPPDTDRQRAFLFAALGLRDPCPDTRHCVEIRCGFGTLTMNTDPYTGGATARLEYRRREAEERA